MHTAWQTCVIEAVVQQTPRIKNFLVRLASPFRHTAGQHVDIRLTAENGYVATRSYSIASSPSVTGVIELAIERISDGEVSSYFHDVAEVGDRFELRGPLGGHFLWPHTAASPILLVGAGSGVAPLMSMVRHRRDIGSTVPSALLLSSSTLHCVPYLSELLSIEMSDPTFQLSLTLTRAKPLRSKDFDRRVDEAMIAQVISQLPCTPSYVFVCGSNDFVDAAADGAIRAGVVASDVRTERYGSD